MMYLDIFDQGYLDRSPVTGMSIPSDINYLRRLYRFNKDAIERYYLRRDFAVKNTHILSRFLEHISPNFSYDQYRYLEYLDHKVTYLSKHFKFTSDIEKGLVHLPYFYGNQGEEIIISNYEPFDPVEVANNWKIEPCISVLTQPRNDTRLLLPLGINDEGRGGFSSVVIDPMRLAVKYRMFLKEQYKNSLTEGGNVLNKNHFVMKYVLPTTVQDNIDHMLLNKVMDKFYGREEVTPKYQHKFKIYEPTTQITRYIDETLETITKKKLDFINILNNIQLIFNLTASDLLSLPDLVGTRQSRWAIVISRLEYMCFLYDVAKDKGRNKTFINDWKRLVERLDRDNSWVGKFSYSKETEIKEQIKKIYDM